MVRRTSPLASGSVLPSSRVMSAATLSKRLSRISAALKRNAPRAGAGSAAHAGQRLGGGLGRGFGIGRRAGDVLADQLVGVGGIAVLERRSPVTHSPLM